LLSDALHLVLI